MKRIIILLTMLTFYSLPAMAVDIPGVDIEVAAGGWMQQPSGDFSYVIGTVGANDTLDVEDDLKYDGKWNLAGRLKVDFPIIPGIYLMAAPMEFDGDGQLSEDFSFGDQTITQGIPFYSKVTLNQYDIGLYYGIPGLKAVTLDKLNVDIGINARIIEAKAEMKQAGTNIIISKSETLPLPLVYLAAQFQPVERIGLDVEARGMAIGDNRVCSLIGRLRVKVFGPVFAAGGYRYDKVEIDESDVIIDTQFQGPFAEAGLTF